MKNFVWQFLASNEDISKAGNPGTQVDVVAPNEKLALELAKEIIIRDNWHLNHVWEQIKHNHDDKEDKKYEEDKEYREKLLKLMEENMRGPKNPWDK